MIHDVGVNALVNKVINCVDHSLVSYGVLICLGVGMTIIKLPENALDGLTIIPWATPMLEVVIEVI